MKHRYLCMNSSALRQAPFLVLKYRYLCWLDHQRHPKYVIHLPSRGFTNWVTSSPIPKASGRKSTGTKTYPGLMNLYLSFPWIIDLRNSDIRVIMSDYSLWPIPWLGKFLILSLFFLRELDKDLITNSVIFLLCFQIKVVFVLFLGVLIDLTARERAEDKEDTTSSQ